MAISERGIVIVVSGVDGAGKSTIVNELKARLSMRHRVETVMAGKPHGKGLEAARRLLRQGDKGMSRLKTGGRVRSRILLDAVPSVILAVLRWRIARKARKLADRGILVISDRWPTREHGKMDGPKIAVTGIGGRRSVLAALATLELAIYRRIEPADVAFFLVVDVQTALRRNADRTKRNKENCEDIIRRHKENDQFDPIAYRTERVANEGTIQEILSHLETQIAAVR